MPARALRRAAAAAVAAAAVVGAIVGGVVGWRRTRPDAPPGEGPGWVAARRLVLAVLLAGVGMFVGYGCDPAEPPVRPDDGLSRIDRYYLERPHTVPSSDTVAARGRP